MMTIQKGQIFKETQSKLAEINDSMLEHISDIANDRRAMLKLGLVLVNLFQAVELYANLLHI
jgi:hypothetical protein